MYKHKITVGSLVEVTKAYMGGGRYAPDGTEGIYFVHTIMDGGADYQLTKDPDLGSWEVIVCSSRVRSAVKAYDKNALLLGRSYCGTSGALHH